MTEICKEFGVSYTTVSGWKISQKKGSPAKHASDETKKLKQELESLKKENEILKKAAAFFAKQLN
jgi:transposase